MSKIWKVLGLEGDFSNNTYKKDYFIQGLVLFLSLLFSSINFFILSRIDFKIIGFFAFQNTVASIILSSLGNFFAFSATRKNNIYKLSGALLSIQIISIFILMLLTLAAKLIFEGKFNLQFDFSLSIIYLIGIRKTFYLLLVDSSIKKKNYILSFINLLEPLIFFFCLISFMKFSNYIYPIDLNQLTNRIVNFKIFSNLISIFVFCLFTYKLINKHKISHLYLKPRTILLLTKGIKFIPFNLSKKIINYFGILITSVIDGDLLTIVAIVEKTNYPLIMIDGILRRSGINKIRTEIPKDNIKGLRIFLINTFISIILFPFFYLILSNNQNQISTNYFIYYFLASIAISLRGISWYSNSLIAKFSVANFGYFSSLLGVTTPIFYFLLRKLPLNFNTLFSLGLSSVLSSLTLIIFWDFVRVNYVDNRKIKS